MSTALQNPGKHPRDSPYESGPGLMMAFNPRHRSNLFMLNCWASNRFDREETILACLQLQVYVFGRLAVLLV